MKNVAKIEQWFIALSRREQVLVLATVLLVPVYLFIQLGYLPARKEQRQLRQSCQSLERQNDQLQSQIAELSEVLGHDVNERTKRDIARVRKHISTFDRELEQNVKALVPPRAMAQLLRSLLEKRSGLTLLAVQNLPGEVLVGARDANGENGAATAVPTAGTGETAAVDTTASAADTVPMLYRHPLELEFSGSYADILTYIRQLQALPRRLFWDKITLEVKDSYPVAQVKLRLYTLSFQKGLIGG